MTQDPEQAGDEPTALSFSNLNGGGSELLSHKKQNPTKFLNHDATIDQELDTL